MPTLVLHARDNRFVRAGHGRYLADHIPGATYVELPIADHVPWANGELFAGEIEEFLTGARRSRRSHRVLATVLFTDIVDSTRSRRSRWATSNGGRCSTSTTASRDARSRASVVDSIKSTGDGVLATFDVPGRAIRAARAMRDAARRDRLQIRAGLHVGEIELRGDDVAGVAVHVAARVAATRRGRRDPRLLDRDGAGRRVGPRVRRPRRARPQGRPGHVAPVRDTRRDEVACRSCVSTASTAAISSRSSSRPRSGSRWRRRRAPCACRSPRRSRGGRARRRGGAAAPLGDVVERDRDRARRAPACASRRAGTSPRCTGCSSADGAPNPRGCGRSCTISRSTRSRRRSRPTSSASADARRRRPTNPFAADGYLRPDWASGGWSTTPERLARWAELAVAGRRAPAGASRRRSTTDRRARGDRARGVGGRAAVRGALGRRPARSTGRSRKASSPGSSAPRPRSEAEAAAAAGAPRRRGAAPRAAGRRLRSAQPRPGEGAARAGSASTFPTPARGGSRRCATRIRSSARCSRGARPSGSRRRTATRGSTSTSTPTAACAARGRDPTAPPDG